MSDAEGSGRLIAVVGASGVGKDSVMRGLAAACPALHVVRRAITRPDASGGEDHLAVSPETFARMKARGAFCLSWSAHGHSYGIPADVPRRAAAGEDLLVNLSRSVLAQAAALVPRFIVLNVVADRDVLAARLAARGRESTAEIQRRLSRPTPALPDGLTIRTIANNGPIEDAVQTALAGLFPAKG